MRDDDVTSHVTKSNFSISLLSCLFRRPGVPNYSNMSHETETGNEYFIQVFASALLCKGRKDKMASFYFIYVAKLYCCNLIRICTPKYEDDRFRRCS